MQKKISTITLIHFVPQGTKFVDKKVVFFFFYWMFKLSPFYYHFMIFNRMTHLKLIIPNLWKSYAIKILFHCINIFFFITWNYRGCGKFFIHSSSCYTLLFLVFFENFYLHNIFFILYSKGFCPEELLCSPTQGCLEFLLNIHEPYRKCWICD